MTNEKLAIQQKLHLDSIWNYVHVLNVLTDFRKFVTESENLELDKQSYSEWVQKWRYHYKLLSFIILTYKRNRGGDYHSSASSYVHIFSKLANNMMIKRVEYKKLLKGY